jgi:hypothetical protein
MAMRTQGFLAVVVTALAEVPASGVFDAVLQHQRNGRVVLMTLGNQAVLRARVHYSHKRSLRC